MSKFLLIISYLMIGSVTMVEKVYPNGYPIPNEWVQNCIKTDEPGLEQCEADARLGRNGSTTIDAMCCSQWQSIICGSALLRQKCSEEEANEFTAWVMKFIKFQCSDRCKDYPFNSNLC